MHIIDFVNGGLKNQEGFMPLQESKEPKRSKLDISVVKPYGRKDDMLSPPVWNQQLIMNVVQYVSTQAVLKDLADRMQELIERKNENDQPVYCRDVVAFVFETLKQELADTIDYLGRVRVFSDLQMRMDMAVGMLRGPDKGVPKRQLAELFPKGNIPCLEKKDREEIRIFIHKAKAVLTSLS